MVWLLQVYKCGSQECLTVLVSVFLFFSAREWEYLPNEYDHATIPFSPFLPAIRILGTYTHAIGMFFKPLGLGFKPWLVVLDPAILTMCYRAAFWLHSFFFLFQLPEDTWTQQRDRERQGYRERKREGKTHPVRCGHVVIPFPPLRHPIWISAHTHTLPACFSSHSSWNSNNQPCGVSLS